MCEKPAKGFLTDIQLQTAGTIDDSKPIHSPTYKEQGKILKQGDARVVVKAVLEDGKRHGDPVVHLQPPPCEEDTNVQQGKPGYSTCEKT